MKHLKSFGSINEDVDNQEDIYRLNEIKDEIESLTKEAKNIIRKISPQSWERARGYWYAHIISALNKETEFLGGSGVTMEETINELE